MQLARSVAVVTGAAGGLGKAFAQRVLAGNGKVLITDVTKQQLEATTRELQSAFGKENVSFAVQDVTDSESFSDVFAQAGDYFKNPLNLVVNNAGIGGKPSFYEDGAPRDWEVPVDITLKGVMRGTQVGLDYFKKNLPAGQEGVIVNISSILGLFPIESYPQYSASKWGVVGFTRSVGPLLKREHNVRVVAMSPGFIATEAGLAAEQAMPDVIAYYRGMIPVDTVADAFVELVNDESNAGKVMEVWKDKRGYTKFRELSEV